MTDWFRLPLPDGHTATFLLPAERDEDGILTRGAYADLADAADAHDEADPQARLLYDQAVLGAVYDLGALGTGAIDLRPDGGALLPAEPPAEPSAYDPLVVQDLAALLHNRSGACAAAGDPDAARADLDASIALLTSVGADADDVAEGLVRRADVRFDAGDTDGALADSDAALALAPAYAPALNNRAVYRAARGDADGALADVQQALTLDPDWALAHLTHAELLAARGQTGAALDALATAVGLDADAAALLDAPAFDALRDDPRFAALG